MPEDLVSELEQIKAERENGATALSEYENRQHHWKGHHDRIAELDAMVRGEFHVVFPDGSAIVERPKVPNIVQLALKDRAGQAASVPFSLRCDPVNERGKAKAEKRERIAANYLRLNQVPLLLERLYMDLSGCGVNYKLILPDYKTGFPCIKRLDPRSAYPDRAFAPDRPIRSLLVAYQEQAGVLAGDYPEHRGHILSDMKGKAYDFCTVLEYYDGSEFIRVAALPSPGGRRGLVLERLPNRIGRVPVAASCLPSLDGQIRGEYDQALSVLNAENRLLNLLIDSAEDWIDSPIVTYGIENPEDYGKAILRARDAQGFARRMPPDQANPQIFALREMLNSISRVASAYPEGRTGTVQQNIISAAGINALQASYNVNLAQLQRLEAASWEDALSLCFAVDEAYLDTGEAKFISGSVNAKTFSETYRPSTDIKGYHGVRVEYGGAAGSDQFNYEIRLLQQAGNGLISRRTARERLSTVESVLDEERLLMEEAIQQAALSYIQAAAANPQQPDFAPAAMLLEALDAKDVNPLLVMAQFVKERGSTTGATQPVVGIEQMQAAGALARGGMEAGPENVPGVGALPPLDQLLVG